MILLVGDDKRRDYLYYEGKVYNAGESHFGPHRAPREAREKGTKIAARSRREARWIANQMGLKDGKQGEV